MKQGRIARQRTSRCRINAAVADLAARMPRPRGGATLTEASAA